LRDALVPLPIAVGVLALVLLWPCVRSGPAAPRLVVEVLLLAGGLAVLFYGPLTAARRLP
jgi:hypothetical protein